MMLVKVQLLRHESQRDKYGCVHYRLPWNFAAFFWAYLRTLDLYVDEKHSRVDYNGVYHFYDVHLFPCLGNKPDLDLKAWASRIRAALESAGHQVDRIDSTWRWAPVEGAASVMIRGARIWIKPDETAT